MVTTATGEREVNVSYLAGVLSRKKMDELVFLKRYMNQNGQELLGLGVRDVKKKFRVALNDYRDSKIG